MVKISIVFQLKHKICVIIPFVLFTAKPKFYSMIFLCLRIHKVRVLEQGFLVFFFSFLFFNMFWNNLGYTEKLSKYLSNTQTLHVCILPHLISLLPSVLLSSPHKYTEIFWSGRVRGKHGTTWSLNSCLLVFFFPKIKDMLLCNHIKIVKIAKLTLRPCWYQRYILKALKFHVYAMKRTPPPCHFNLVS